MNSEAPFKNQLLCVNIKTINGKKQIKLLLLSFVIILSQASAQWTQTGGPSGGSPNCLERVGNEMWAGFENGIYVSVNDGASWQKHPLFNNWCRDIKAFNDTIIVCYKTFVTGNLNTYKYTVTSFDGGNSWQPEVLLDSNTYNETSGIYKSKNTLIIKGFPGYYISADFGLTWNDFQLSTNDYMDAIFSCNDDGILAEFRNSVTFSRSIHLSTDGTQTWTDVDSSFDAFSGLLVDTTIFLAADYNNLKLVRSFDFGLTWDTVYNFPPNLNVVGFGYFNGAIYYPVDTDYIVSYDNGNTWSHISFPQDYYPFYDPILLSNGDVLNLVTYPDPGVGRFIPSQNIVYPVFTGIAAHAILNLQTHNGSLYASTYWHSYKSDDGGMTWSILPIPLYSIDDFSFSGDTIIGDASDSKNHICRSFDNGVTWDTLPAPRGSGAATIEIYHGKLYMSNDTLYESNDWGLTWNKMTTWLDSLSPNCNQSVFKTGNLTVIDDILYITTEDGYILKYDSINLSWSYVSCFYSPGVNHHNTLYKAENYLVVSGSYNFLISADNGITWTLPQLNGLPSGILTITPHDILSLSGVWFGTCGSYGVYYSLDHGDNWLPIQNGTSPFKAQGGLTVLNNVLYAGSFGNSVWRRTGTFGTLSGNVYHDLNNNGNQDAGESGLPNIIVRINPTSWVATTDSTGFYSLLTDATGDSLMPVLPSTLASSSPSYYITPGGTATGFNFGIYMPSNIADLEVDLTNVNIFRSGFTSNLNITVLNKGSVVQPAQLQLHLDTLLSFVSASVSTDSIIGNEIYWHTDTLQFLQTASFSVTALTSLNASIGDSIHCSTQVNPVINDTLPLDNYSELNTRVRGSYDPNEKECLQGYYFTPVQLSNNEDLEFIIRFQNLGNAPATTVQIIDTLSNYLDLTTLRIISASHTMQWNVSGIGILNFYFDNIQLQPASVDELNSHGYVKYSIRCKHSVSLGDAIINSAHIYFDFNPPIQTNTTTTLIANPFVVALPPSQSINPANKSVIVFPNPSTGRFYLDANVSTFTQLKIFNDIGVLIKQESIRSGVNEIKMDNYPAGLYIGLVTQQNYSVSFKFIINK